MSGGAGTALAVNVDNSSLEINADALRVKALGVTGAMLAAASVDDTKAGDRVPQFYRRQGGNASDWSIAGATAQTPGPVRMQGGRTNRNDRQWRYWPIGCNYIPASV